MGRGQKVEGELRFQNDPLWLSYLIRAPLQGRKHCPSFAEGEPEARESEGTSQRPRPSM